MSHRTYVTPDGTAWKVWEVTASFAERRRAERRAAKAPAALERRRGDERRRVREVRAPARPGFENGWLTFESLNETRRYGPVPPAWTSMSDAELEALRKRGYAAPPRRHRLIE
ncbi:MAG TPA: hypothetical protein VHM67_01270 [Gemmatimonadaceae bacterium]|nr:hypothetical protein [Gemmatimonadaceae bacterium]